MPLLPATFFANFNSGVILNAYLGMIGEIKTTIYFLWMTASVLVACLGEKDKIR